MDSDDGWVFRKIDFENSNECIDIIEKIVLDRLRKLELAYKKSIE
jgi:hypothetical protein